MTYTQDQINEARQKRNYVLERVDIRWDINIEELYQKYTKYKAEYGTDLKVETECYEDYGSVAAEVEFVACHPETDEEVVARLNLENRYASSRRELDLKELARLKKLYE